MSQANIRIYVSNLYDIQKLRVASGNRIIQAIRDKTGLNETSIDQDKDILKQLRKEYTSIQRECNSKNCFPKTAIKNIASSEDSELMYVLDESLYGIVQSYISLTESEEALQKLLDKEVREHPMWGLFFKDIKGCGTLMAGVCLTYLDPYKAKYISSFYRYAGVDTVSEVDKKGNAVYNIKVDGEVKSNRVTPKIVFKTLDGDEVSGDFKFYKEDFIKGENIFRNREGVLAIKVHATDKKGNFLYTDLETGNDYSGDVEVSQVGRRKWNTEEYEYIDKNGKVKIKKGLTYNPILKTKLIGVLGPSLLKHGGSGAERTKYRMIFDNYRARLDKSSKHKDFTDLHKYNMSIRYMIKQFLRNLHIVWREYEGLPDYGPYEEVILGHKPHKLKENF